MSSKLLLYLTTTILLSRDVRCYDDKMVEITELLVPESPRSGDDVTLTCRFRLVGYNHRLYTVNWWRGKDQFYTYKGTNFDPKHAYTFRGIQVKKDESTEESVVLENVSEDTSGIFKCEVMGEGPSFRTAVEIKTMNVVVPPKQVDISAWSNPDPLTYRSGDSVEINCTATGAKPKARITWKINDIPVREHNLVRYPDFEERSGRVTSKMGLRWRAPDYFRNNVARVTCIATVGGHNTKGAKNIYLDPASSAAFNHQFGAAGSQLPTAWTILSLASILIARSFP